MKYLITGVGGFIASKTAQFLLEAGHKVVGVDNLNDYYDKRLKYYRLHNLAISKGEVNRTAQTLFDAYSSQRVEDFKDAFTTENFTFIPLDIEDKNAVLGLFKKHSFDGVLNLAARAGVRYSMIDPDVYMRTNAMGTLNLMDAMKRDGIKKLVLASTSSLYAGQKMPFNEDLPVNSPISPYAASKKSAEMLAHSYHYLYDLDISVVRYFTVFGPAGRPDMCIFRFIKWIDEGTPIELFGDGSQSRDFTHVDDIARGTIAALIPLGYEVINLGGGNNPISLLEIIRWIERELNKKAKITNLPFHKADIKSTWADINKAKSFINWEPRIDIEEGVVECVEWYKTNKSWVKNIKL